MARVLVQVERLERPAAFLVQHVERLDELQVIAHLGIGAGPAAAIIVHDIGRSADRRQDAVPPADLDVLLRIAGAQFERRRRHGDALHDHGAVEAHPHLAFVDIGARRAIELARLRLQHAHADLLEDGQAHLVDRLHLVGRQDLDRRIGPRQLLPRPLFDAADLALRAAGSATCRDALHGVLLELLV